jgi:hypothetical protein
MRYKCAYTGLKGVKCKDDCCVSCERTQVCESKCPLGNKKTFVRPKCQYVIAISEVRGKKHVIKLEEVIMLNEAIKKIQDEIDNEKNNSYVQYVGKYMIEYLNKNQGYADNILDESKSIKGSLKKMEEEAKKVKQGNMAMFTPDEGLKIVIEYFGIEFIESEPKKQTRNININLDELF